MMEVGALDEDRSIGIKVGALGGGVSSRGFL